MTLAPMRPYGRAAQRGGSWWYLGCLVSSLAEASETAGQLSAVEAVIRKGVEPPSHVHANEDEAYYVVDGRFTFRVGDQTIDAPPGTFVWLPRGVPHTFEVEADGAKALILCTPGGFMESMFRPFSTPAEALVLPPVPDELPIDEMMALDRRLGVTYPDSAENLSPGA
jgi:quercetin dioxygenase-like cupin family protein